MKILLIYPEYPVTFWSFKYALRFVSKKAAYPPLGLLTVAALLPAEWEKKLVDMNVKTLDDRDLLWADYVFISVDHLVLGEAEVTLPAFLEDLKRGKAKHLYTSHQRADITTTPALVGAHLIANSAKSQCCMDICHGQRQRNR